jgi:hypothetical protein
MQRAFPCGAAALAIAFSVGCSNDRCAIRDVTYNGWQCVELSNGRIDVVVAPQLGGRIVQLRFDGCEYLWVNRDLAGKVLAAPVDGAAEGAGNFGDWANYGGDKLWPAPQGWNGPEEWPGPPDPFAKGGCTDRGAFTLEVLANHSAEVAVRLTGPKDLYAGVRFSREIRLRPHTTSVALIATMENIVDRPVRWGIWQVTQHDSRQERSDSAGKATMFHRNLRAWTPIYRHSRYPKGYRVMFGPEDAPQFSTVDSPAGKLFRLEYRHQAGKAALDTNSEWLAVTQEAPDFLYAHTFPVKPDAEYPDGASVEFWTSGPGSIQLGDTAVTMEEKEPWLVESELLSPYVKLAPGEKHAFATSIHLAHGTGPVLHVTENTAVLEQPAWTRGKLAGTIAFFRDGSLSLAGSAGGAIRDVRAGEVVDLSALSLSAGPTPAHMLLLLMEDANGQSVQEIHVAPPIRKK